MRDTSRNEKQKKQTLELLAEHFLRITGQDRESVPMLRSEIADTGQRRVTLN